MQKKDIFEITDMVTVTELAASVLAEGDHTEDYVAGVYAGMELLASALARSMTEKGHRISKKRRKA